VARAYDYDCTALMEVESCSICSGLGVVAGLFEDEIECPECDGTGEMLCKEQTPISGEQTK
jgi:hypothetical protein